MWGGSHTAEAPGESEGVTVTEETRKIAVTLHVKLVKIIDMPVSILAEAEIDESGDVYNDAVAERMKPAMDLLCGWDDWTIEEEDHEQVEEWKMVPIGEAAELVKKEKEDANNG